MCPNRVQVWDAHLRKSLLHGLGHLEQPVKDLDSRERGKVKRQGARKYRAAAAAPEVVEDTSRRWAGVAHNLRERFKVDFPVNEILVVKDILIATL